MEERVIVVEDAFNEDFCNKVLSFCSNFEEAKIYDGENSGVKHQERVTEVSWITNFFEHSEVIFPFMEKAKEINREYYGFDLNNIENLQVAKYTGDNKSFFKPHMDMKLGVLDQPRKLSVSVMLSSPEEYTGGDFVIFGQGGSLVEVDRLTRLKKGTAIYFPSYIVHGVEPVTSGVRHSLVGWLLGPRFK